VEFEWDQNKSKKCFTERGFDFAYAAHAFLDPNRIAQKDSRYDYGETRYQLISKIEGRVFVVIYTMRNNVIRIISARKANKREVKYYDDTTDDN
jgi:hypothetical protein